MKSPFFFSIDSIESNKSSSGSFTEVTSQEVPGFVDIAFADLRLNERGSLEPLWHPNAHKVGYCTDGNALVTIRTPSEADVFTVKKGEIFFIPKGYVHHVENIGKGPCVIHFALNHTKPETMWLSKAVYSISDPVFNSTFETSNGFVDALKKNARFEPLKTLPPLQKPIQETGSRFKFNIEASQKPVLTKGGYLQIGTSANLPTLIGLGILGFGLHPKGIVEPHWHTNAGELVYIVKGTTRITVLSPDGKTWSMEVKGGEGAFAPASHFHNIENIGSDEVEVIAFFSDQSPDYIGIGEVVGSYPNELLASVFNKEPEFFDSLKKSENPLVIVPI